MQGIEVMAATNAVSHFDTSGNAEQPRICRPDTTGWVFPTTFTSVLWIWLELVGIVSCNNMEMTCPELKPILGPICSISSPLFALCQVASPSGRGWRSPHSALRTARAIDRSRAGSTWRGLARLQHKKVPMMTVFPRKPNFFL